MGPTSALVVLALCAVAAGVVAAVVVLWRRLAQPAGPGGAAVRALSQLLVVLTSVLAVAAMLNRQYDFYTTWPDLFRQLSGASPAQGQQSHAGAAPHAVAANGSGRAGQDLDRAADAKYAALRDATQASLSLRPHPGPKGQFVIVHVPGLGGTAGTGFRAGRVVIWLPPSYTDPRQAKRTYPVIEAFHGIPGGPRDWHRVDHLDEVLASVMSKRDMGQAVVVMPDYAPNGLDTECVDGGGIPMETWLTKDVPQWTISHLRVRATPKAWATMGYSAGGWCAAVTGLLHPHRYAADIVMGGYFRPEFTNWHPFAPGHTPARYDLQRSIARTPPASDVWIQVATSDPTSGPQSQQFVRSARAPLSVTAFTQQDVGHRVAVYMAILPRALSWLGSTLPAFSSGSHR